MLKSLTETKELYFWLAFSSTKLKKKKLEDLFYVSIDSSPWINSVMSSPSGLKES